MAKRALANHPQVIDRRPRRVWSCAQRRQAAPQLLLPCLPAYQRPLDGFDRRTRRLEGRHEPLGWRRPGRLEPLQLEIDWTFALGPRMTILLRQACSPRACLSGLSNTASSPHVRHFEANMAGRFNAHAFPTSIRSLAQCTARACIQTMLLLHALHDAHAQRHLSPVHRPRRWRTWLLRRVWPGWTPARPYHGPARDFTDLPPWFPLSNPCFTPSVAADVASPRVSAFDNLDRDHRVPKNAQGSNMTNQSSRHTRTDTST